MYDKLAQEYDHFVNWKSRLAFEMPFLVGQLDYIKKSKDATLDILDAACGTGMHAIALAKLGYQVSGADISQEMISIANANALEHGTNIDFRQAGFGSLSQLFGINTCDAVLCLGNSLPHVLSKLELDEVLKDFYNLLKPGGLLILQNRNFDSIMSKRKRWMEPQAHREGDNEWVFQRFYDFEDAGLIQFNFLTLKRKRGENWQVDLTSTLLMPLFVNDLLEQLVQSSFKVISTLGGLNDEVFDPLKSENLVIVAQKPF